MAISARCPLRPPDTIVSLPESAPPRLFVVVDTEEEFDWTAPFSRENTSVTAMRSIGRVQGIFDRYDVKPTYVIDFPVASQPEGYGPLRELLADDRCTIGAHLHPWVTPPFDEELGARNSFACNLSPEVEAAKLTVLQEQIQETFGLTARIYKAGRYGLDTRGAETLETLGFEIDVSVNPLADFSAEDGPSFVDFGASPFFMEGRSDRLFFLPCTVGFIGRAGTHGRRLHALASSPRLSPLHAVGILARLGIANRVMLSPEGNTLGEMKALATALHARGLRTFSLTFHSPSVEPGHTPYVRGYGDLSRFLDTLDRFCEFFFEELDGMPGHPFEFRSSLMKESCRC